MLGNRIKSGVIVLFSLMVSVQLRAAEWSSSNIQLLHGSGYRLADERKTILTIEHANRWRYGDNFFFLDAANPNQAGTLLYAELTPQISIGRVRGVPIRAAAVRDVMLSANIEMGAGLHSRLLGIAFALDLPGFDFANIALYRRQSFRDQVVEQSPAGGQLSLAWARPFMVGDSHWQFEGFADYAFGENGGSSPKSDNLLTAPRLLLDAGAMWGEPGHLFAGIEYQFWRNKYGVEGVDERVSQAMVKWLF